MVYYTAEGNTEPLEVRLTRKRETVGLNGATVTFAMQQRNGDKQITGSANVTDADAGKVEFVWGGSDLDSPGIYDAEFDVTYASGKLQSYPGRETLVVVVRPSVD